MISTHAERCLANWLTPTVSITECLSMPEIVTLFLEEPKESLDAVNKAHQDEVKVLKDKIITETDNDRPTEAEVTCNE